jgi:hypothetical protein
MKAILEFNLPEDQQYYDACSHGMDWALVAWELDQELRKLLKYGNDFKSIDDALESVREKLNDFVVDYGLDFNSII